MHAALVVQIPKGIIIYLFYVHVQLQWGVVGKASNFRNFMQNWVPFTQYNASTISLPSIKFTDRIIWGEIKPVYLSKPCKMEF